MPRDRRARERIILYRARLPGEDRVHEARYDSVADALHFACRDLREGRRNPLEIVEDEVVVHDAEGIARECRREQERIEARLDGREQGLLE